MNELKNFKDKKLAEFDDFTMPYDNGVMFKQCSERCMTEATDIRQFISDLIDEIVDNIPAGEIRNEKDFSGSAED